MTLEALEAAGSLSSKEGNMNYINAFLKVKPVYKVIMDYL